jgi:H+/Cl- antiporter ClcA
MWRVAVLGLVVLVPTVMAAKAFLQLRVRITADALVRRLRWPKPVVVGLFAVVAGLSVAAFPLAAGNGMDAIDRAPIAATTALAVALVVGKSVGTTAAPVQPRRCASPTMGVAGGTALLVLLAADSLGAGVARPWDAIVPAMAVGVAVGMRSPLVAVFLVPELLGDYSLVIPVALVVAVGWLLDRALDRLVERTGGQVPTAIYDEDA